jgi:hypothetical protein
MIGSLGFWWDGYQCFMVLLARQTKMVVELHLNRTEEGDDNGKRS